MEEKNPIRIRNKGYFPSILMKSGNFLVFLIQASSNEGLGDSLTTKGKPLVVRLL
jgi:hypothetical protein